MFGPSTVPQYRDYARDIHQSGRYLLSLINDILDLSRIEAGRRELNEEAVDLAAQATDCVRLVSFRATERRLSIVTRFAAEAPHVLADARAVRQIWLNLLTNAVKFTDPGGCIEVSVEPTAEGGVVMAVRDNGSGVAEGEVREVLKSFARGRSAVEGAVEGAGLGLSIVDGLARMHDATLHFDSVEGRGTHVRIVFPPHRTVRGGTPYAFDEDVDSVPARRRLVTLMDSAESAAGAQDRAAAPRA
ncbi:MAG TPA: HAMP domain-containing histidine kinase [Thermopetrobacter sp.]|nr:HAMP domain-containing histidine kinase [Thermopetrobacter sp.]